eukprot:2113908-Prymnesium_polylepis.1
MCPNAVPDNIILRTTRDVARHPLQRRVRWPPRSQRQPAASATLCTTELKICPTIPTVVKHGR